MLFHSVPLKKENHRFFLQSEYAFGYIALSESSGEEGIIGDALLHASRLSGRPNDTIMDIGCGDGRLTQRLSSNAKGVTIYEPNPILYSLAVSKLSQIRCVCNARNTLFPATPMAHIPEYDLIIASHMLYHVERTRWTEFFTCISNNLHKAGLCIVVLWNNCSEAKHLSSALVPSRWLCTADDLLAEAASIQRLGLIKVEQIDLHPYVTVHTQEMARLVTAFLIGNGCNFGRSQCEARQGIEERVYAKGVGNSQTLIVFQKQFGD